MGIQFRTCENFGDFADSKSSLNPQNSHKHKSHTANLGSLENNSLYSPSLAEGDLGGGSSNCHFEAEAEKSKKSPQSFRKSLQNLHDSRESKSFLPTFSKSRWAWAKPKKSLDSPSPCGRGLEGGVENLKDSLNLQILGESQNTLDCHENPCGFSRNDSKDLREYNAESKRFLPTFSKSRWGLGQRPANLKTSPSPCGRGLGGGVVPKNPKDSRESKNFFTYFFPQKVRGLQPKLKNNIPPPFGRGLGGRIESKSCPTHDFNDADLMLFDSIICFDNTRQKIILISGVYVENLAQSYKIALENIAFMEQILRGDSHDSRKNRNIDSRDSHKNAIHDSDSPTKSDSRHDSTKDSRESKSDSTKDSQDSRESKSESKDKSPDFALLSPLTPRFSREEYCAIVERAKRYIIDGDIFQVVLSNPIYAHAQGSLLDCYRLLRSNNPSPYMFYLKSPDLEISGASPETLVRLENGTLYTYPLAGSIHRGRDEREDSVLKNRLLADTKECAEHNMLVDLGRNDIGKVAKIGSVRVLDYMNIALYSHIMHISSCVCGELAPNKDALDALDAILPAGTLSGAPKIRACEIIDELERDKRGIYGGAVGYIDFSDNMDMCIAIRFAYKRGSEVCVRSGAGIVYDSNPNKEFDECLNKAGAVLDALKKAQDLGEKSFKTRESLHESRESFKSQDSRELDSHESHKIPQNTRRK